MLNREYSYELVAATEDISFHHPNLWISRLDPDQECSALIMAKDCSLKKEDVIRISSSTKGGTIKDEPTSVPPNYGAIIVVFIIIAILGSLPILGFEGYERWKQHQGSQYAELLSSDSNYEFSNVTSFFYSDLAESYKEGEFPFHIKEVRRKGEYLVVDALAINETAAPMDFYVSPEWPYDKDDPEPWKSTTYKDVEVAPKDKKIISISIYWPSDLVKNDKNIDLKLDLESGAEMITNIIITIPVEAQNEKDS
ncbi:hypothetical protein [uncultured Halovibrio sp.]|uniref:hypothetical protein n=1 Tax=uncultured Halovibrio sp. TaxID=985049 RepID=UPI0025E4291D|nr:hypothetical protein [uncultured Halovibrio sp.]